MKKILALIVLSIAMVACYEDYLVDYPYTAVYFPLQQDVRSFVVGEGMKFEVGVALGGVRQNTVDRNVQFSLDASLLDSARLVAMKYSSWGYINSNTKLVDTLKLLPLSYYDMTPSTTIMVIPSGWHAGTVLITADSVNFLNDSLKTIKSTYALPFRIDDADADSILPAKSTNVVGTMFVNKLFGNYWHGGRAFVDSSGIRLDTIIYKTTIPVAENKIWTLVTVGPTRLSCNGYYNGTTVAGDNMINVTIKGTKIYLSPGTKFPTATYTFAQGACTFNNPKLLQNRKIFLNYSFTQVASPFWTYNCTDTLTFRNRIRDGVNEWQDENPLHYTK
jgi:hypothetical protein